MKMSNGRVCSYCQGKAQTVFLSANSFQMELCRRNIKAPEARHILWRTSLMISGTPAICVSFVDVYCDMTDSWIAHWEQLGQESI